METKFIVNLILNGEKERFSEILKRYSNYIKKIAFSFLHNQDDVDDACQEIALKVYKGLPSFSPTYTFKSWLAKISVNHLINTVQRDKSKQYTHVPISKVKFALSSNELNQNENAYLNEMKEKIENCINKLNSPEKEIFLLFHRSGLNYIEISEALNIPLGTIKTKLHRTRKLLYNMTFDMELNK